MVRALAGVLFAGRHPGEVIRRGNIRHEAQENLRAHADSDSTQTHEEKIDGGEVADSETKRNAREIAIAEEKSGCESESFGNAIAERVFSSEKEKVITESDTGVLTDRVEQEEETQEFSHAVSFAGRFAFGEPKPDA
jgi:hypothetical protein